MGGLLINNINIYAYTYMKSIMFNIYNDTPIVIYMYTCFILCICYISIHIRAEKMLYINRGVYKGNGYS